jgi:hypothetical protein
MDSSFQYPLPSSFSALIIKTLDLWLGERLHIQHLIVGRNCRLAYQSQFKRWVINHPEEESVMNSTIVIY